MKPLLPREHGSWGLVLIPFLTAVAVAGRISPAVGVALAAVLFAFLARTPAEVLVLGQRLAGRTRAEVRRWALVYGSLAAAAGAALLVVWRLYELVPLAVLAAAFFGLHAERARRTRTHTQAGELLGTVALTLSAPVGWVAATGGLDSAGLLLWLLNAAFFCSGVLYVRARIRARQRAQRGEPNAGGWLVAGWHVMVAGFVLLLVQGLEASWLLALPFAVGAARAGWSGNRPSFNLRRLGWTEVALSIFFAGCLTLGFHL